MKLEFTRVGLLVEAFSEFVLVYIEVTILY